MEARYCPTCGRARPIEFSVFIENNHEIRVGKQIRRLGYVKWALLSHLRKHQGEWVSADRLFGVVYGISRDAPKCNSSLRVHVHYIRKAMEGTGFKISTAYGLGYRLDRDHRAEDVARLQARLDQAFEADGA